jgi:UDP-N-acetylmuramate dehydrogenase
MGEVLSIEAFGQALEALHLRVRRNVPMRDHTTWRIGGPADGLVELDTFPQLIAVAREARRAGFPLVVIGRGSNLLFADKGFRGVVLQMDRKLGGIQVEGSRLVVEAGALACRVALAACRNSLEGLEHIAGIPGTLGGLIAMNGGSLRQSVGEAIEWVEGCDGEGRPRRWDRDACRFAYRDSLFLQDPALTIFRCSISLKPGSRAAIRRAMLDNLRERRRKFPRKAPSCGSVFKSSPELYAMAGPPGRIIELCGFKGRRVGGAEVSPLHANFIVNTGGARASDVLELIHQIRNAVHDRFGVWMETEARYVRPQGGIVPAHTAGCDA